MVRKQVYIEAEQERALKELSARLGVTEAELIRRGIDAVTRHRAPMPPDPKAWEEAKAFIDERMKMDVPQTGRTWTREELYDDDERFKRFAR